MATAVARGDAASMVAVGLVWGATNALMPRGALVWDRRSRSLPAGSGAVRRWADLLLTSFLANLSASSAFVRLLGDAPISVAVPVTNATTFAATAVAAALLGEDTRAAPAALGTARSHRPRGLGLHLLATPSTTSNNSIALYLA
ncbi:hypothetical protein ACQ4PT_024155 [Festuca glaucescens]